MKMLGEILVNAFHRTKRCYKSCDELCMGQVGNVLLTTKSSKDDELCMQEIGNVLLTNKSSMYEVKI